MYSAGDLLIDRHGVMTTDTILLISERKFNDLVGPYYEVLIGERSSLLVEVFLDEYCEIIA